MVNISKRGCELRFDLFDFCVLGAKSNIYCLVDRDFYKKGDYVMLGSAKPMVK